MKIVTEWQKGQCRAEVPEMPNLEGRGRSEEEAIGYLVKSKPSLFFIKEVIGKASSE